MVSRGKTKALRVTDYPPTPCYITRIAHNKNFKHQYNGAVSRDEPRDLAKSAQHV